MIAQADPKRNPLPLRSLSARLIQLFAASFTAKPDLASPAGIMQQLICRAGDPVKQAAIAFHVLRPVRRIQSVVVEVT
jgi:hypothetical protein